jgi:hypothetical protein
MIDQSDQPQQHPATDTIPLPQGLETGDTQAYYSPAHSSDNEKAIFQYLLHPADSYTAYGVYWADLPLSQRVSFSIRYEASEAAKELSQLGAMIKRDPLAPIGWYFRNAVLPGAGIGLEGYVIFSIGNLSTLYTAVWPTCWKTYAVCTQNWIAAVTYMEIIGIVLGQFTVGLISDG